MRTGVPTEAGPLLDTAMARTLWRALVVFDADEGSSYLMGEDGERVPVPAYSTDPEAATRVLSVMQSRGWTLSLKHETQGRSRFVALFGRQDGRTYRYVEAATVPHALCLAALWAVSGSNVEPG